MRKRQEVKVIKLLEMRRFIEKNADRLPRTCGSPALREFDELLLELRDSYDGQQEHRLSGMSERRHYHALREALIVEHMTPLVVVARLRLDRLPELKAFVMPPRNQSAIMLSTAAKGMAQSTKSYAEVFVAAGLAPDFDLRLVDAADAMMESHLEQDMRRIEQRRATGRIETRLRKSRHLVRLLSVFVRQDTAADHQLLDAWRELALSPTPRRVAAPAVKPMPAAAESLNDAAPDAIRLLSSGDAAAAPDVPQERASANGFFRGVTRLLRSSRRAGGVNDQAPLPS